MMCRHSIEELQVPQLINFSARRFQEQMRKISERLGIKDSYRPVLGQLAHKDGVTQLQLAQAARLTAPTISVTVQRMEADGLVERRHDEHDLRQIRVYLTEKGKALDRQARGYLGMMDQKMMRGITEEEIELMRPILVRMLKNLLEDET